METGLVLKVWKMNYEFLLKNYLDRKLWSMEWTLFEYKQYKVTMNLWSIQTRLEEIYLDIKVHYTTPWGTRDYQEKAIRHSLKIQDASFLKREINSAIFDLLERVERWNVIENTEEYIELVTMKQTEKRTLTEIAEEFLDNADIDNDNIRNAYTEAYVEEWAVVPGMISDYLDSKKYKTLPDLYLTWLECLDDDNDKNNRIAYVKDKLGNNKYNEIMKGIEEYKQYMKTDEYVYDMESKLEEV